MIGVSVAPACTPNARLETGTISWGTAWSCVSACAVGGSVISQTLHWSEEMSFLRCAQIPAQRFERSSQGPVQVFTFVEGFSSSIVMLWNGRSLLLMAA